MKNTILIIIIFILAGCNSTSKQNEEEIKIHGKELQRLKDERQKFSSNDFWDQLPASAAPRSAPFSKGVNFSGWFESSSAHSIPFTKYTEQDFIDVKSLGADVIRLPVRMHSMTGAAPNYTLDPLLLKFLDIAADWAEKHKLYLIIDNHSFDPVLATSVDIDKILIPVWAQVARHFRNRSEYIIYEILNEPHGISDSRWGEIQRLVIQEIRKHDQKHAIIAGGTDYNSVGKLLSVPRYDDQNLIYTFHFYDPHIFTHQGATWGEPSLANLKGVPFPYDISKMPELPANLRGTWVEGSYSGYSWAADFKALNYTLERVSQFAIERNVPVFCGEFGVFMPNSNPVDRILWYEFVTKSLDRRNISRTSWDYYGGFGVFNSDMGDFNHDLNIEVVRAMGFNPPVLKQRQNEPLNESFAIYDDYPNRRHVTVDSWGDGVDFSLYDQNAEEGEFAVRWGSAKQYNAFSFHFKKASGDFSKLKDGGFFLEFKARCDKPVSFDVRFINSESQSSIPWRMRYTINENTLPSDGRWHTVRIPLSEMNEHGAWVNAKQQWMPSRNEFSWSDIERLEFAAEHSDLTGARIWFDNIRIVK